MDDELEWLRRANPVHGRTGDQLAAPHSAAFREAIDTGGGGAPRQRAARGGAAHEVRLVLVAAAVALVALPATLLVRDNTDEIIVRTPATNGSPLADDRTLRVPYDDGIEPTVTTAEESDDVIDTTADHAARPSTSSATTTEPVDAQSAVVPAPIAVGVADETTTTSGPAATSEPTGSDDDTGAATGPVTVATVPATSTPADTVLAAPPTSTSVAEPVPPVQTSAPALTGPFDPTTDLLMVTFDFAHLDDGHAAVATLELADAFGFDPVVVAGTAAPESDRFTHDYASVMSVAWDSGWLDAGADRAAVRSTLTQRWLSVIDGGGEIWVAEGGVSDFTAAVLSDVRQQRPGLDTRSIVHVVHHAASNLDGTQPADRQLLDAHVDLVQIDDGNDVNGTAGLNGASTTFEDIALAGTSAPIWAAAFDSFPASSLDFSDTVTVLHALGIGVDVVANVDDFATVVMA